jgi:hypothetical protein
VHQLWVGSYIGGRPRDPWLQAFVDDAGQEPKFAEARAALARAFVEAAEILGALTQAELVGRGHIPFLSRWFGWTAGQLLCRSIAHLYIHAADLNTLAVLGGGEDSGLPVRMEHVRGAP